MCQDSGERIRALGLSYLCEDYKVNFKLYCLFVYGNLFSDFLNMIYFLIYEWNTISLRGSVVLAQEAFVQKLKSAH